MNARMPHWWLVNIGSGNGLVVSSNKPFPETNDNQALSRYMASLGHNELILLSSEFFKNNPSG